MKTLYSLTQPLTQLRHTSKQVRAWLSFRGANSSSTANILEDSTKSADLPQGELKSRLPPKHYHQKLRGQRRRKQQSPVVCLLAIVSLTSVMGNRFYNQPKLDVGRAAPQSIRAPHDATVEDTKTTEERRKAARTGFVAVLMLDHTITQKITQELQQSLDQAEEIRQASGSFPFVETTLLSETTQQYLRQCSEAEWQAILTLFDSYPAAQSLPLTMAQVKDRQTLSLAQAISELRNYRQSSSVQAFSVLLEAISQARQNYAQALRQLSQPLSPDSSHRYDASMLELSDEVWQETRRGITQAAKQILTQGIPPGLPPDILQQAVSSQVKTLVPSNADVLASQILIEVLQPNLTEDKEQTKRRAEQAAQAVEPEMVSVKKGEVIVEAGETITQADFVLLDYFKLSRREINWTGLAGFTGLVSGCVVVFWLVERQVHPRRRQRDRLLVLLLALSTPVLTTLGTYYTDLPAVGLLVGSFYSPALGITVVGLLTGLLTFSTKVSWDYLLAGAAAGLLGALMAGRLRSREELALLGGAVGLTQGGVYLILNLMLSSAVGSVWYIVFKEATLYGLAGLSWSVVALGISPYLERLFDLVTPIRLAELSNPNRPLLKRLAAEAPGTFQHTLFVASLAEAAARELHCNVELVRAGTLYHDIGKMHDPLGFIENQMGDPNKHDEINNPWQSAEIIKKHVSEGLVMARRHQLPKAIRDFIPEHQGTLLISYFYFQAQQKAQAEGEIAVEEEDFRYDGPIPQSRETGIVMLADACEAALRSLKDVTPETALSMINKILKARWQDNQLVDSGLTREDLAKIAQVFVRVWQQCNHQRIAYPKAALNCQQSSK